MLLTHFGNFWAAFGLTFGLLGTFGQHLAQLWDLRATLRRPVDVWVGGHATFETNFWTFGYFWTACELTFGLLVTFETTFGLFATCGKLLEKLSVTFG